MCQHVWRVIFLFILIFFLVFVCVYIQICTGLYCFYLFKRFYFWFCKCKKIKEKKALSNKFIKTTKNLYVVYFFKNLVLLAKLIKSKNPIKLTAHCCDLKNYKRVIVKFFS